MVPVPIAMLSLGYGILAAMAGTSIWKVLIGSVEGNVLWPAAWLVLSLVSACGLALLKPWARTLAIVGFVWITLVILSLAGVMIASGRPVAALAAVIGTGVPLLAIRYLRRPIVRELFVQGTVLSK